MKREMRRSEKWRLRPLNTGDRLHGVVSEGITHLKALSVVVRLS